jgi:Domain of unknown function (DUF3342)
MPAMRRAGQHGGALQSFPAARRNTTCNPVPFVHDSLSVKGSNSAERVKQQQPPRSAVSKLRARSFLPLKGLEELPVSPVRDDSKAVTNQSAARAAVAAAAAAASRRWVPEGDTLCSSDEPKLPAISSPRPHAAALVDVVTIHVCDDGRNVTRDFQCSRALLLSEMQYFKTYLSGQPGPQDDVDILVHCDIRIFEWLFRYVHWRPAGRRREDSSECDAPATVALTDTTATSSTKQQQQNSSSCSSSSNNSSKPRLEVSTAVSILISSDFLRMDRLVQECLAFVARNFSEVVKLPIDLACLTDSMVASIAKLMTLEELATAKDRRDKLLSRLHKKVHNTLYCTKKALRVDDILHSL